MKKLLLVIVIGLIVAAGALALYIQKELRAPFAPDGGSVLLEIPRGMRARDVVGLLEEKKVIRDRNVTLAYIFYSGQRHRLQAGEYLFDRPASPIEVVAKIANGQVFLRKFTVPEGLSIEKTAAKWQEQGFGTADEFLRAAAGAVGLIHDLDPQASSLEGYIFPETYSLPSRTTARQVIETMVGRFRKVLENLEKEVPRASWPLGLRETVILASLVESEAAHEDERELVASVYHNRIGRKMLLQCDPTVIYALEREGLYKGRLTLADLRFQSPYNTYVTPGLPPGPIMSPGHSSLKAAIRPGTTNFLFFVRTIDGRHTFSENLAGHNRAVAAYRAMQRGPGSR